ncbi:MAG TPA: ABC transporter permease [Anaerolineales bacterium]|nr:ABC transporter permease [Anaerolineales bacterium]
MLLFGLGYRNEARVLRTIFVASPDNPLSYRVEAFATNLGPQLVYLGILTDEANALGAGFVISLISQTDTQAVQYTMLLLLASIFFSGFFLDLRLMWEPLSILSRILPATYGI